MTWRARGKAGPKNVLQGMFCSAALLQICKKYFLGLADPLFQLADPLFELADPLFELADPLFDQSGHTPHKLFFVFLLLMKVIFCQNFGRTTFVNVLNV